MYYLQDGETLRSRLDYLLFSARGTQNSTLKRDFLDEASVVAMLLRADEEAAFHAASLGGEPEPLGRVEYLTGVVGYTYTEQDVIEALHPLLNQLLTDDEAAVTNHLRDFTRRQEAASIEKAAAVKVYPFHDDPRIDDSAVYNVTGADTTPRLPSEQMPATDPAPATEFEFDTSAAPTFEELDEEEQEIVMASLDEAPADDRDAHDEEEEGLEDFDPVAETRQAPNSSVAALKKLQDKKKGRSTK